MTPQASTEELFCRYRQTGDSRALTEVFDRTAPELLALASHLAGGLVEAEDLVQHTFLVAIEKARRFKEGRELLPWLAGILIREAQKQRRNRSRRVDPGRVNVQEAPEGERIALNEELRAAVAGALGEIPAKYQGVLRPFLLEGLTATEIAKLNSSAAGTVRVQLHRGLDLLRRALPTGIGLGVAGVAMPRGLGNVRLAVEASALSVPIAATSAVPLLSLATVMTTKTLVLGSTLAALLLGITLLQRDRAAPEIPKVQAEEAPPEVPAAPPAPLASEPSRRSLKSEAAEQVPAPEVSPSSDEAAPQAAVAALLRGVIQTRASLNSESFALELRAGSNHQYALTTSIESAGAFTLDLAELLGEDDPGQLEILVICSSGNFRTASTYAELSHIEGRTAIYEVELEPAFIEFTIRGRVLPPEGRKLQEPKVTMMVEDAEMPPEFWNVELAERNGDRFALRLPHRKLGVLFAWAEGTAVTRIELPVALDNVLELDPIQLSLGSSISGRVLRDGEPLPMGSEVFATLEERSTPFTYSYAGMLLDGRDVLHQSRMGKVEEDGNFKIEGLKEGIEYHLVGVPHDNFLNYRKRFDAGTVIRAPAQGIELDWGLVRVQAQVRFGSEPVKHAKAMFVPPALNSSLGMEGLHGGEWLIPVPSDSSGLVTLLIPAQLQTEYEFEAPGYTNRRFTMDANALPADRTFVVQLEKGALPAAVTFSFEGLQSPLPDGTSILLRRLDPRHGMEPFGPVLVQGGEAHFADLPIGLNELYLLVLAVPEMPFDDMPLVLSSSQRIRFADLVSGEVRNETVQLLETGRIEVSVTGRDPALKPPAFELIVEDRSHQPQYVYATPGGHERSSTFQGDGPCSLDSSLVPAEYLLRLLPGDYEGEERLVTVKPGERLQLTFDLRLRY